MLQLIREIHRRNTFRVRLHPIKNLPGPKAPAGF